MEDSEGSDAVLGDGHGHTESSKQDVSMLQGEWHASSDMKQSHGPSQLGHSGREPAAARPSSAAMTLLSGSAVDRSRPTVVSGIASSMLERNGSSSSPNPSASSSASSTNTISQRMSSSRARDSSSATSSSLALNVNKSRDSLQTNSTASLAVETVLPSPRGHSEPRQSSHPPISQLSSSHGSGSGNAHNGGGLLHPLRMSTRPSTKRASSFSPGLVVSPQGYGAPHTTPSSPLHSPVYSPSLRPDYRSGSIDLTSATAQASSISLPISGDEVLHHKLEELVRKTSISDQHHQHGLLPDTSSIDASSANASTSQLPSHLHRLSTSFQARDGYEAEREQDSEVATSDPSQPSSLTSDLQADLPSILPSASRSPRAQHSSANGPYSRKYQNQPQPPLRLSPHKPEPGGSREYSGSSNDHPDAKDFALDEQTDPDLDTGTDLASDAGNTTWDVRETDKLRSAKDKYGRRMINQYARVAELGKGVHGKVWLCEDTETQEFYAIKSVNREDRRNKSLKRSQAEAQARAKAQELEDEAELVEQRRSERERNPNASFDEEMQLSDPIPQLSEKELAQKRTAIVRKTMMDEKVKQEIAIMKRIHHPNVVQLREVIDDIRSKKIFMGKSNYLLPMV